MSGLERREPARPPIGRDEAAAPDRLQPGAYELGYAGDDDHRPSPALRRRRLIVGVVAVVAIIALAVTAIGVGSIVFLI